MTEARGVPETPTGLAAVFAALSREPDLDAAELQAYDSADELLLATAADRIRGLAPGELVVIGDRHGALAVGAAVIFGADGIRVHQDPLLGERALAGNAERAGVAERVRSLPLGEELLAGARVVLLQLPRGLEALEEIARAVARFADPDAVLFAGGRVKHMSRSMNDVLAGSFASVSAGLGARKSRVITASRPLGEGVEAALDTPAVLATSGVVGFPRWGDDPDLDFRLAAFGATFGGPTLDHGSRLLLAGLADAAPDATRIVDLGCGNGSLAVAAARARPAARVIATDQSDAAVRATRITAEAAGVSQRVEVVRADGVEEVPDGWAELILLNPPFHSGALVHAGVAHRLIAACARALAPAGELRLVFNSHLGYRPLVERVIGPTRQVARDRTFTVLAAVRRSERPAPSELR